jgi:hypothetical protein
MEKRRSVKKTVFFYKQIGLNVWERSSEMLHLKFSLHVDAAWDASEIRS